MGAFQMHFIAISINHRTADVALRKQVAFRDDALRIAHEDLYETKSILENVILSTCNRTEYTLLYHWYRSLLCQRNCSALASRNLNRNEIKLF